MVAQILSLWNDDLDEDATLLVDCLLPTGIIMPLSVKQHATIAEIKELIWKEAHLYPLYNQLKNKDTYVLMCINEMATKVELEDESKRLSEVKPFALQEVQFTPMLKVVEKKGNRAEKILNAQVGLLIGKGVHEFDALKSSEVSDFRQHMRVITERVAKERDAQEWLHRVTCLYPPELANTDTLPTHLEDKVFGDMLHMTVRIFNSDVCYTLRVRTGSYPEDLIQMAIDKRDRKSGTKIGYCNEFVLKVCGRDEYLMGFYPLSQFMYLRRCVGRGEIPQLILMPRSVVLEGEPPMLPPRGNGRGKSGAAPPPPPRPQGPNAAGQIQAEEVRHGKMLWDLSDHTYTITIKDVTNLISVHQYSKVQIRIGIYHGDEAMCSIISSKDVMVKENVAAWSEELSFDINLSDLPRMSKLCFVLQVIMDRRGNKRQQTGGTKIKVGRQEMSPLAWVNIPVFDYKGYLRTGTQTMYMWNMEKDQVLSEELLNPLGTVEFNPRVEQAACLTCNFSDYNLDERIHYPVFERVMEVAAQHITFGSQGEMINPDVSSIRNTIGSAMMDVNTVNKTHLELLRVMVSRDPLHPLHVQDKEHIWRLKFECHYHFPESLPKLLCCVQWNNHIDVAQMQALLQIWAPLPPTQALELLDCQYADKAVRRFAVKCLTQLSDSELCQYLLQLVQVLKYELYLECELVEFLLHRALNNRRIGHFLFWLLKSEMHIPSVSVRFGLILEAYCHGNQSHLQSLTHQTEALNIMAAINQKVKKFKVNSREKGREMMKNLLNQKTHIEALSKVQVTLDPSYMARNPRVEKCRYMDSKMKPLWMVFENMDVYGNDMYVMYKNGDDLRQDMLTLQIIRIMDNIWQEAGLDLRLNIYDCLATGKNEGFIGIVTESKTLANIQKEFPGIKLKSAFNRQCIYEWLKKENTNTESMDRALEEFTLSCAGYCVATYVLGVADRHSDNIMIRTNGQLFHIDFGHILGNFKSKLGVKRERVPFVLTTDFVYCICRGEGSNERSKNAEFTKFREVCTQAFLVLRSKANFLISLFLMMMNTGLQEVSSTKDVSYLKETLVPELTEEDAKAHFLSKFQDALKNSWKTSVNNAFHNLAKDNV